MSIVVSGIRPTGPLHLGNYFGAVKLFVELQEKHKCFFFIADWHALTTHPDTKQLNDNVLNVFAEYLSCGLDPQKAIIYRQSHIPEIAELYLLLNMHAYLGELERTPTFKEKARKQPNNVNIGLLSYPVLMAADILIQKASYVPVGKDQEQHLEIVRKFVRRFNRKYNCDVLKEPLPIMLDKTTNKIPALDNSGKMGKTNSNNAIFLTEAPDLIAKKVMRAVTDSGPEIENAPKSAPVENLFSIMKLVSSPDTLLFFENQYNHCKIRYGDFKKQLAEDMVTFTERFRQAKKDIVNNFPLKKMLKEGGVQARENAISTLKDVKKILTF